MARIKVGFDIGGSSMKAAVVQGGGLRVETVRLPEKLIDENGITMPNAFSQFLKQTVKELRLPHGPAAGPSGQPGDLPPGEYAGDEPGAADDEPAL